SAAASHRKSLCSLDLFRFTDPRGILCYCANPTFWTLFSPFFLAFRSIKMKIELCSYSGYKIYPGHGKRLVKADGKVFQFMNSKCEASHLMRRNPRKTTWTVLYRRKHKKGL